MQTKTFILDAINRLTAVICICICICVYINNAGATCAFRGALIIGSNLAWSCITVQSVHLN